MATPTHEPANASEGRVADADKGNWVDAWAPASWRPYLRLARADRPIGTWLLLFPCWWSLLLALVAGSQSGAGLAATDAATTPAMALWYAALFALGAFVMRGAGCTYNDYVDRDFDAKVARTRSRPIPSGQVRPKAALVFILVQALIGLAVLLQFNAFTIALGIASLALVLVYPFMKRFTYWPQLVLGLTFNWGALVGWAAVQGSLEPEPILLYAGAVLWTVAYDTIYAHQDKEDDLSLGLKSTAIRFGERTPSWLAGLFAGTLLLWSVAAYLAGAGVATALGLMCIAAHFAWQVVTLDTGDAENCLLRFKANRFVGWFLAGGLMLDLVVGA